MLVKLAYCCKIHQQKNLQPVVQNEEHQALQHSLYLDLRVGLMMLQWQGLALEEVVQLVATGVWEMELSHFC